MLSKTKNSHKSVWKNMPLDIQSWLD